MRTHAPGGTHLTKCCQLAVVYLGIVPPSQFGRSFVFVCLFVLCVWVCGCVGVGVCGGGVDVCVCVGVCVGVCVCVCV